MDRTDTDPELARLRADLAAERRAREEAERTLMETTAALRARQGDLALLVAVARAANDATDLEAALGHAIACVCGHTGWPVGHVFLVEPDVGLRSTRIWHLDRPEQFETFRRITESTTLGAGESLGGRVLQSGRATWQTGLDAPGSDFAQSRVSSELGVRTGFAFPILVGSEVVGVMEFFNDAEEPPDERLLDLLDQIGTELGRAIERDRAAVAQRMLHRELAARATELERSNAELEGFASIASHDLQEPLRKVRTFTQRVQETEADHLSERGADYLGRANAAAERMQTLIQDLLAFSRVGTRGREFAPVDLAQVLAEVLEDLEAAIETAGARIEVRALPEVDADALQMRQLLQNLLANALKFRRPDLPAEILVEGHLDPESATIVVQDDGIGFDPRYAERIFRVFERLHGRSEYPGTGIGLALCRKIVERHGGRIEAASELGAGARFTVTLPRRQLGRPDPGPEDPTGAD